MMGIGIIAKHVGFQCIETVSVFASKTWRQSIGKRLAFLGIIGRVPPLNYPVVHELHAGQGNLTNEALFVVFVGDRGDGL